MSYAAETGGTLVPSDDEFGVARVHFLLLALAQQLGLGAAYCSFRLAAECEDRADRLRSASWEVLGRTIIVALSLPRPEFACAIGHLDGSFFGPPHPDTGAPAIAAEPLALAVAQPYLAPHATRIANNLEVLADAGRKGGSVSAAAVSAIAQSLSDELRALFRVVDRLLTSDGALLREIGR